MTKSKKRERIDGYNPRLYAMMKVVYSILTFISIVAVIVMFYIVGYTLYGAHQAMTCTVKIQRELENINSCVTKAVIYHDDVKSQFSKINSSFNLIEKEKTAFTEIKMIDELTVENFDNALSSLDSYHKHLEEVESKYLAIKKDEAKLSEFFASLPDEYRENISPLKDASAMKISEFVSFQTETTTNNFFSTARSILILIAILMFVYILGMISIDHIDRAVYKQALRFRERSDEVIDLSEKAVRLREKAKDIAYINILTGLRNRYGLEDDISSALGSKDIGIALFNFDKFRGLNENYGREFGDEFISVVAERVKSQCSQFAEIYNFAIDEFCFVFKNEVSEIQVANFAGVISEVLSKQCTIRNINIQLSVSGAAYLCKAGECSDINTVLLKMDTAIREAKSNGGANIVSVNKIVSNKI